MIRSVAMVSSESEQEYKVASSKSTESCIIIIEGSIECEQSKVSDGSASVLEPDWVLEHIVGDQST